MIKNYASTKLKCFFSLQEPNNLNRFNWINVYLRIRNSIVMVIKVHSSLSILFFVILVVTGCKSVSKNSPVQTEDSLISQDFRFPEWAKDAVIYEVNIRQYTDEGTFKAFQKHLPRLQKLGVDILWLMPINPISETKRKGELGSYYAVSSYRHVNPEFGTEKEFDQMVNTIHKLGMRVILDWVPNHTGWDHDWITSNPDFYTQDSAGTIIDPIDPNTGKSWGWTDVADLNYENQEMRSNMIAEMKYWLTERNIDGFRCDVAHGVPLDFWITASMELYQVKPIFMLAESEIPAHRNSGPFLSTYAWEFHHKMNEVAKGHANAGDLHALLQRYHRESERGFKMYFTSNHDENSWAGTVFERMGDAHQALAVLASTLDGIPLIYSGQEEPLRKRLEFFKKDPIEWKDFAYSEFYSKLFDLKERNQALWNGRYGGKAERMSHSDQVYMFSREKNGQQVVVVINLDDQPASLSMQSGLGSMINVFSGEKEDLTEIDWQLAPWEYRVYEK